MKSKFETEIEKLIESYIDLPYSHKTLIEEISETHQQATKDEREKIIKIIKKSKKVWGDRKNKAKNDYSLVHRDKIYNHYKSVWIAHFEILHFIKITQK